MFKKIVIANNCAVLTNQLFDNYTVLPGSSLLLGAMIHIIEIYADFSGYSDMAIGFARLIGFDITKNFNYPFFAQNIADFWQRWHISLTTWMTEYVFTPLSFIFRDWGKAGLFLAILTNFILVGLWHGTTLTYLAFGFLNGCYFIPLIIKGSLNKKKVTAEDNNDLSFKKLLKVVLTFLLVSLTGILLRSASIWQAIRFYKKIFSASLLSLPKIPSEKVNSFITITLIIFMLIVEWMGREQPYGIAQIGHKSPKLVRWIFYYCLAMLTFLFASRGPQFIYFQF